MTPTPTERPRILVVEDDYAVVEGLLRGLRREGFDTVLAMDGAAGAKEAIRPDVDLVLLDLMLPERDGWSILEAMHDRVSTPVIVVSARTELDARLRSFRLGAIDFVPKPFFLEELVARIRSRLAIREDTPRRTLPVGGVALDVEARRATRDGVDLGFTAHEFNLLLVLAEHPNRAISRQQLAERALPEEGERLDRTVDSHLSRVRKKLGPDGHLIQTAWGIGYRFEPNAKPVAKPDERSKERG